VQSGLERNECGEKARKVGDIHREIGRKWLGPKDLVGVEEKVDGRCVYSKRESLEE
jgi:hypothetical protein